MDPRKGSAVAASSLGRLTEQAELFGHIAELFYCFGRHARRIHPTLVRSNLHVGAQRDDHPTSTATGPRRPHQMATGSAAPSTTSPLPQAAPATRGMVSTRTSAPV